MGISYLLHFTRLKNTLFLFIVIFLNSCTNPTQKSLKEQTYSELETVLTQRKNELSTYLKAVRQKANKVNNDTVMRTFFNAKRDYYALSKEMVLPENIVNSISSLKKNIQQYYLLNYLMFYDILFVDINGDVFYTIRKEQDYHQNIYSEQFADIALSKQLKSNTKESFVDFQFYDISGEPSAFFIEPVINSNQLQGWFVFQFAINKINNIFQHHENLGKTGETILVNKDHYLLSNSRFSIQNTILKQKLAEENIISKFKERKGRKKVVDYRGNEVMSVFEVFEFFDTEWLLIAKKDLNEVRTDTYLQNTDENKFEQTFNKLQKQYPNSSQVDTFTNVIRVDMDETHRSDSNEVLFTQGVSTCTAIIADYPGAFTYMAHISPFDKIYGKNRTDLLGQLLKNIEYFDIADSEKQHIKYYIVSVNNLGFNGCVNTIIENGYFLSQIEIAYNPDAEYANVHFLPNEETLNIDWIINK